MLEPLPNLASLSDAELKNLQQQLQDTTLKALDALGAEIDTGRLTAAEGGLKGDQLVHAMAAQQDSIFAERMQRTEIANRKLAIIKLAALALIVAAVIIGAALLK